MELNEFQPAVWWKVSGQSFSQDSTKCQLRIDSIYLRKLHFPSQFFVGTSPVIEVTALCRMNEFDSQLESLLIRARGGDQSALGRLLDWHREYLKVVARRELESWLVRKEDESDLVQQTLLEAGRDFPQFRGNTEGEFLAWLLQIHNGNVNDAHAKYRTQKRDIRQEVAGDAARQQADSGASPARRLLRDENAVLLAAAMECLTEAQYEAVRLKHLEGRTFAEIARRMDRSEDAVVQLSREAIKKLRTRLKDLGSHFAS